LLININILALAGQTAGPNILALAGHNSSWTKWAELGTPGCPLVT